MGYKKEPNHIKIFQNKRKKLSKHPDMIGTCIDPNGIEFDIALWKLVTQSGDVYFAGRIGNTEENRAKYGKGKQTQEKESDIDRLNI